MSDGGMGLVSTVRSAALGKLGDIGPGELQALTPKSNAASARDRIREVRDGIGEFLLGMLSLGVVGLSLGIRPGAGNLRQRGRLLACGLCDLRIRQALVVTALVVGPEDQACDHHQDQDRPAQPTGPGVGREEGGDRPDAGDEGEQGRDHAFARCFITAVTMPSSASPPATVSRIVTTV